MRFAFLICVVVLATASSSPCAPMFFSVSIEFQENGQFIGVVGKAYVSEDSIDIVALAELVGLIVPSPYIYRITEKKTDDNGVIHVTCRSQADVTVSGTIDRRDFLKPKILLKTDKGILMTNITEKGRSLQNQYIPNVDLGR
ncbi:MAG: hypothetical protein ABFD75_06490 [Smithella sp.]